MGFLPWLISSANSTISHAAAKMASSPCSCQNSMSKERSGNPRSTSRVFHDQFSGTLISASSIRALTVSGYQDEGRVLSSALIPASARPTRTKTRPSPAFAVQIAPRVIALIDIFQAGISHLQRLPASITRATIYPLEYFASLFDGVRRREDRKQNTRSVYEGTRMSCRRMEI